MDVDSSLFSIVVPTFNREGHLGRSLGSIARQSFSDYEVIVVDNASTDDTVSVAGGYANRMDLRIVVNDLNRERFFS